MTVGELRAILTTLPDDAIVISDGYSGRDEDEPVYEGRNVVASVGRTWMQPPGTIQAVDGHWHPSIYIRHEP